MSVSPPRDRPTSLAVIRCGLLRCAGPTVSHPIQAAADGDKQSGSAMQCDKNDYRAILAGLEGVTTKKAVDLEAMTVKN